MICHLASFLTRDPIADARGLRLTRMSRLSTCGHRKLLASLLIKRQPPPSVKLLKGVECCNGYQRHKRRLVIMTAIIRLTMDIIRAGYRHEGDVEG